MGQSAFPGIEVLSVETEDVVGQQEIEAGSDEVKRVVFTTDSRYGGEGIRTMRSYAEDIVGDIFSGETNLVYTMKITALGETPAKVKAREFVRVKNIFEPNKIDIISVENMTQDKTRDDYLVTAGIEK